MQVSRAASLSSSGADMRKTTHPEDHIKGKNLTHSEKVGERQNGTAKISLLDFFSFLGRAQFVKPHCDTFIYI